MKMTSPKGESGLRRSIGGNFGFVLAILQEAGLVEGFIAIAYLILSYLADQLLYFVLDALQLYVSLMLQYNTIPYAT